MRERERESPSNVSVAWPDCLPGPSSLVSGARYISQIPILSERYWLQILQEFFSISTNGIVVCFPPCTFQPFLWGIRFCICSLLGCFWWGSKDSQAFHVIGTYLCFLLYSDPTWWIDPSYSFSFWVNSLSLPHFHSNFNLLHFQSITLAYLSPNQALILNFILALHSPECIPST